MSASSARCLLSLIGSRAGALARWSSASGPRRRNPKNYAAAFDYPLLLSLLSLPTPVPSLQCLPTHPVSSPALYRKSNGKYFSEECLNIILRARLIIPIIPSSAIICHYLYHLMRESIKLFPGSRIPCRSDIIFRTATNAAPIFCSLYSRRVRGIACILGQSFPSCWIWEIASIDPLRHVSSPGGVSEFFRNPILRDAV